MSKFCIFCGKKPEKKNKEHIIPKWLIKLTGDENRTISLGLNFNDMLQNEKVDFKNRLYSFNSFQFPACTKCNSDFSEFENSISIIFKKILKEDYVDSKEIDLILDWFDKLRIGLWLGSITLDKIKEDINPKFFINNRIGTRDRALYVYKLKDENLSGINFHGFNTPGFQFAPCIIGFRINNYFFINYSREFLLSKNLGFPYFENVEFDENSRAEIFKPFRGTNKITTPILNTGFYKPTISFFQSVLDVEMIPKEFHNEYLAENLLNKDSAKSKIFYYDSYDKKIFKLENDEEIIFDGVIINSTINNFNKTITKNVIEELESLLHFKHHLKMENKEKSKNIEENRKYALKFHQTVKELTYKLM